MRSFLERLSLVVSPNYGSDVSFVKKADRLLNHEFDVLGSGPVKMFYGFKAGGSDGAFFDNSDDSFEKTFSEVTECNPSCKRLLTEALELRKEYDKDYSPIPWHSDIKNGYKYAPVWHTEIPIGTIPGVDVKTPSELSRGHNLLILAQAYRFTSDIKYRNELISQLLDWISVNPPFYGPAWRNGMNVAIRAANIIVATAMIGLDENDRLDSKFAEILEKTLRNHRRQISLTLEIYRHHNHISAELAGMILLCSILGNEKSNDADELECAAWGRYAWFQLNKEICAQIDDDGFDFEGSTSYHAYVLEMFVFPILHACRVSGCKTPSDVLSFLVAKERFSNLAIEKLKKASRVLRTLTQPDGTIPYISDNDAGRYVMWEIPSEPADMKFLLCTLSILFDKAEFLPASVKKNDFLAASAFFDSGYFVTPGKPINYPIVYCYPGTGYQIMEYKDFHSILHCAKGSGHCNNDQLAITLCIKGETFVVDPGTYSYTGNPEMRSRLRSINAHSTVSVTGIETDETVVKTAFGGGESTLCKFTDNVTENDCISCGALHKAYNRLEDCLTIERIISLNENNFVVNDLFTRSNHPVKTGSITERFVLHPECSVSVIDAKNALVVKNGISVTITTKTGSMSVEESLYSKTYGKICKTKSLVIILDRDAEKNAINFRW